LVVSANNSWVIAYDNLSHLPTWVSDALCRIATGSGFGARALYTNREECLLQAQRPIVLNGIEDIATRGDLLDRSVIVYLPAIEEERRLTERNFERQFQEALPEILGGLLDSVSSAMRNLPGVELKAVPRMADFCEWVIAAEPGLGWKPGTFLRIYRQNRTEANTIALDASAAVPAVMKLVEQGNWEGTATDLQEALNELVSDHKRKSPAWPKSARAVSATLKRLAPNLREVGVDVEWIRKGRDRVLRLKVKSTVFASFCDLRHNPGAANDVRKDANNAKTQDSPLDLERGVR
jgi:hypothetical protein